MNEKFNDILFFRVWRNIVINRVIFKYSRLYIKNKQVMFKNIQSLREYGDEREFITKLVIRDNEYIKYNTMDSLLSKGDLPEYGMLKEIDLTFSPPISNFDAIPNGVEIINFNYRGENEIQLTELPSSVHTITNVKLKKPYANNQIPTNIKSISFFIIDSKEFYNIKLPTSIVELNLKCLKFSVPISAPSLKGSFIPSSVTSLTTFYDSSLPSIPTIPKSVKKLTLTICGYEIEKGLIPNSVTELKLIFSSYPKSFAGLFPNGLTRLSIDSLQKTQIPKVLDLPSTLQYLIIDGKKCNSF